MKKYAIVLLVAILCLVGCTPVQPALSVALASPENGGTVSSLTPILAWTSSGGATSYRLQVANDVNFSNLIIDEGNLGGLSYSISSGKLNEGKSYYWRVNASKGSQTSSWSSYWVFQTTGATDTIVVSATLNGSPWSGVINYTLTGPKAESGSSVPKTFSNLATGSYTIGYSSGGPSGATFDGITPSATQTLSAGGTITFTLNFKAQHSDTILVNATVDGSMWQGQVNYTIHGSREESSSNVPETFSDMPNGTYTISYSYGGPDGATLSSISPSPTQTLSSGGTITYTLNFHRTHPASTIYVNATLDGVPWEGSAQYSIHGPRGDSSYSVPDSFSNMPSGTYTVYFRSGGPAGATLSSITPQPTLMLQSGSSISFTFNFHSEASGTMLVEATLDGASWAGNVEYTIHGPYSSSKNSIPHSYSNLPAGTYTLSYRHGGPPGARLVSITPSPTQTLRTNGRITFTLNFHAEQPTGTIMVDATLDGKPWQTAIGSGQISYSLHGPRSDSGHTIPATFSNNPGGSYTLSYLSGGPTGATLSNISPSSHQNLSSGGTISFTLNFHSQAKGRVMVRARLDGKPWEGEVSYVLHGPYVDSGGSVPDSFSNCPQGTYTLSYSSGGPHQSILVNVSPPMQELSPGGTITFTLNFKFQSGILPTGPGPVIPNPPEN